MATTRMKNWFPTTSSPLIVSAPMAYVTNVQLATEVTKAGGLGTVSTVSSRVPPAARLMIVLG